MAGGQRAKAASAGTCEGILAPGVAGEGPRAGSGSGKLRTGRDGKWENLDDSPSSSDASGPRAGEARLLMPGRSGELPSPPGFWPWEWKQPGQVAWGQAWIGAPRRALKPVSVWMCGCRGRRSSETKGKVSGPQRMGQCLPLPARADGRPRGLGLNTVPELAPSNPAGVMSPHLEPEIKILTKLHSGYPTFTSVNLGFFVCKMG